MYVFFVVGWFVMARGGDSWYEICRELSDEHDYVYGVPVDEVSYGPDHCEVCGSRIDAFGYCACGGWSD